MRADLLLRPVVKVEVEEDCVFSAIDAHFSVHLVPILPLVGLRLQDALEEVADAESSFRPPRSATSVRRRPQLTQSHCLTFSVPQERRARARRGAAKMLPKTRASTFV